MAFNSIFSEHHSRDGRFLSRARNRQQLLVGVFGRAFWRVVWKTLPRLHWCRQTE